MELMENAKRYNCKYYCPCTSNCSDAASLYCMHGVGTKCKNIYNSLFTISLHCRSITTTTTTTTCSIYRMEKLTTFAPIRNVKFSELLSCDYFEPNVMSRPFRHEMVLKMYRINCQIVGVFAMYFQMCRNENEIVRSRQPHKCISDIIQEFVFGGIRNI